MKKNKMLLCLTSMFLLFSCGGNGNNSTNSQSSTQESISGSFDISSSVIEGDSSSSTIVPSGEVENDNLKLKMFGDVYLNGIRTIYAETTSKDEIVWETSNKDVIAVSVREDLNKECSVIARGYGEAYVTAYLKNSPEVMSVKKFEIKEGTALSSDVYSKITGGLKVESDIQYLSFNSKYESKVDIEELTTTIYEENFDSSGMYSDNLTDAYQLTIKDPKTNAVTKEYKYVRSTSGKVATESLNVQNQVDRKSIVIDEEEGTELAMDNSYYVNFFALSDYITADDFRTFDGGKTYHFIGGYLNGCYLGASLYLMDSAYDDIYFEINGSEMKLNFEIDPYNENSAATVYYGQKITASLSEFGTAKIDHVVPFAHETYHDKLDTAIDEIWNSKNYTVSYTMDYGDQLDRYDFTFTNDTIDQVISTDGKIVSHTGIHRKDENSYVKYSYNDVTNKVKIEKTYGESFDAHNQYPTFDFASEIFDAPVGNTYTSRGNNGRFIAYCLYLPTNVSFYSFDQDGTITLDADGHLKGIQVGVNALGQDLTISASFSKIGTSSCDIDFTNLEDSVPASFDEGAPKLTQGLKAWNAYGHVPYLHPENGFYDYQTMSYLRSSTNANGVEYMYFRTNDFSTEALRDKYVEDYKQLLLDEGYVKITSTIEYCYSQYEQYEKDGYRISVGCDKNWNGSVSLNRVVIFVQSDLLVNGNQ